MQKSKYYEHSGTIGLMGLIYIILAGAIGSLLLGAIYGYAIFYIPFIYLNFFITLGFGGILGLLIGYSGKFGKVRNTKALVFFGLIFGIFAQYIGWVSWIHAFSGKEGAMVASPSNMYYVVKMVADNGAWSIFGWTPKGFSIYSIWTIEALMIIGASTLFACIPIVSTPFCERCNKWIDKEEFIFPLEPIENVEILTSQLEGSDFTILNLLKETDDDASIYTQLKLLFCPDCQDSYFLTVTSVEITEDDKGEIEKNDDDIIENFVLTSDQYNKIKELHGV
ncbi:MAG: hypothetical protein GY714_17690 [Desulfobacterales bacterium]|nr:hypothetical protein [Desulfobacterales bacterium]